MTIVISKKVLRVLKFALVPLLLLLVFAACDMGTSTASSGTGTATGCDVTDVNCILSDVDQYTVATYYRLAHVVPPVQMTDSLARREINQRYQTFNNASTFGYFYGFVNGVAQPVVEYVVKGAIFPVNDQLTPQQIKQDCNNGSGSCSITVEAPQADGTFGTNGSALFGFEADGTYFEWDGPYAYATHPLGFRPLVVHGCTKGAEC